MKAVIFALFGSEGLFSEGLRFARTDGHLNLFFTGPWSPDVIVEQNRRFAPAGTDFRYYNYAQLEQSAEEISGHLASAGVPGAYAAFRLLRPYSYRADLWRYMVLWMYGGLYLDAKMVLRTDITGLVDAAAGSLLVCADRDYPNHYVASVIFARRGDPVLEAIIRRIVANVESRYYGETGNPHADLDITGPGVLTRVLAERGFRPHADCRRHGDEVLLYPEGAVQMVQDAAAHDAMRECADCNVYGRLFQAHAVYCDEPALKGAGDPCVKHAVSPLARLPQTKVKPAADAGEKVVFGKAEVVNATPARAVVAAFSAVALEKNI